MRERLPSASRAKEKDFDLTSTKVFLTSRPPKGNFVDCLKEDVPSVRTPWWTSIMGYCARGGGMH